MSIACETKQLCTFTLANQHFGIDAQLVQEVIRYQEMTDVPLAPSCIRGLINLRGQIVTALDLRIRFGMPPLSEDRLPMNIVIRTDDGPVSLLVDKIGDVVSVDQEDFESPPDTTRPAIRKLLLGAYKLRNQLLLVINTSEIVSLSSETI